MIKELGITITTNLETYQVRLQDLLVDGDLFVEVIPVILAKVPCLNYQLDKSGLDFNFELWTILSFF